MGTMIDGIYRTKGDLAEADPSGEWQRRRSVIRNWITPDGLPGPTGDAGFPAERGRYHLYVAWNCPWAHRALLARLFKRLEDAIDISVARPRRTDQGWVFDEEGPYADGLWGVDALHEAYARGTDGYTGGVTVPLLIDKATGRAVSNESADIVRMLNRAFPGEGPDLYPEALAPEIDAWNVRVYETVNNGVYRAGFATTQEA